MGFSDRLRAWLKGESKTRAKSPQTSDSSREAVREIKEFVGSRIGVEAYLEPKTTLYSTTVLLVADDGEYLRRPVKDRGQAASLCDEMNIPLYDARKVGYPKRMRDYDQGRAPRRVALEDLPPWPGDEPAGADADGPPPPPVEELRDGDGAEGDGAEGDGDASTPEDGTPDASAEDGDEPRG